MLEQDAGGEAHKEALSGPARSCGTTSSDYTGCRNFTTITSLRASGGQSGKMRPESSMYTDGFLTLGSLSWPSKQLPRYEAAERLSNSCITGRTTAVPRAALKPRLRLFRLMSVRGAKQDLGRLGGPKRRGHDRRAREIYAARDHSCCAPRPPEDPFLIHLWKMAVDVARSDGASSLVASDRLIADH
ncbi:hypothetical protein J7T55_012823 [Diaporthe amygdali]|uniref:uncharacterized protein n=1 Tax=Phomopsis amygdali TaxID=1214568 RepID=UPI0022FDDA13|nr:uncharacterized protein J7T55_012823 [Diaporthe amygdali]KAJ0118571.1 hypothetical protein J7T55_012823 [Diaporthe amygdali]